jgi:hypothetical protein
LINIQGIDPSQVVYAALSFFILPPLTQFLTAKHASGAVKSIVLTVLSFGIGIGTTLLSGGFTETTVAANVMVVALSAIAGYKLLLKDFSSLFGDIGPQLGQSTAPPPPAEPPIAVTVVDKDSVAQG